MAITTALTTNPVKSLQKQSESELSIFTGTLDRLEKINVKIRQEKAKRLETISKLKEENDSLESTEGRNQKLADKIRTFLED